MQIERIKFRNFISYGNKMQEIVFERDGSLSLLKGENGSGKTTIISAVTYALYGKVPNKTLGRLPNYYNKKLHVEIFVRVNGGLLHIIRGISPKRFDATFNDVPINSVDLQAQLEERFYGIPYVIFKNIISLSLDDFKSFVHNMSVADKRTIVDRIFGLEIFNRMLDAVRKVSNDMKKELYAIESNIRSTDVSIQRANNELESLLEKLKTQDLKKEDELKIKVEKLTETRKVVLEKVSQITDKKQRNDEFQINANRVISSEETMARSILKQMKLYENDKCPTCGSSLKTDEHDSLYSELKINYQEHLGKIREVKEKIDESRNLDVKITGILDKGNSKLSAINYELRAIKNELSRIALVNGSDSQTESIQTLIDESLAQKQDYEDKLDKMKNKQMQYDVLQEFVSEKGMKQAAIKNIVPMLNYEIGNALRHLDSPFNVFFDERFDAKITRAGFDILSEDLSKGQMRIVDFAVLLSFVKIIKVKFPALNVIFLDEVFASVDGINIYKILDVLKDMSKKTNLNVVAVHHSELHSQTFDYVLTTDISTGFSVIDVEKVN